MNVAAIQYRPKAGPRSQNLKDLLALSRPVASEVDLLVLPELAATPYIQADIAQARARAEAPEGETFRAFSPLARAAETHIVAGFIESAADRLFNSALIIGPDGALTGVYRKRLLYEADEHWATPGDTAYPIVQTPGGDFTVGICMDLNDDRFIAHCAAARCRAIAFPSNWLAEVDDENQEYPVWNYWAWRLQGVESALVAANTWGDEGETTFCGRSAVLDHRVIRAGADATGDATLGATLPALEPLGDADLAADAP